MGFENSGEYKNIGINEKQDSLKYDLNFLTVSQSRLESNIRNYVLNEKKTGRNTTKLTSDLSQLVNRQRLENESLERHKPNETKDLLDKEALIQEAKIQIYEMLGINENIGSNSSYENFSKGFVDEIILGNYEMAVEVINTKGKIILDALKQLATFEGIKKIAEGLKESVGNLFLGNAYEKGKSVAELGLVVVGVGVGINIGKKGLNLGMKQISKLRVNKENIVNSPDVKGVVSETRTKVDDIVPKKKMDFKSMIINDIAKLNDIDRIEAARFYLGNKILNPKQELAIIKAHNIGEIGNYSFGELKEKVKILQEAGFDSNEIKTMLEKGICGKEKLPDFKSLYEDPRYDFLENYKDILGENIDISNIMGEGVNGIVLKHPVSGVVIKIRKPGMDVDDIGYEIKNHEKVGNIIRDGKKQGLIDGTINIPEITTIDPGYLKTYFVMEKIEGQTLSTKIFRNEHPGLKLENPKYLDSLTDREIIELMIDKYGSSTEYLKQLRENNSPKYLENGINREGSNLNKALKYLKEQGIEHTDLHSGNIMIDNNGKIYIIDFGTVKNTK